MRANLFSSFTIMAICFAQVLFAQNLNKEQNNPNHFNEKAAYEQAKLKGIKSSEISGYVQFLKNDFSSKKALEKQTNKHSPYTGGSTNIQETVIYLEPNKPMSLGCPNMAFEQYNFNGWTGGTGTVSAGSAGGNPMYNSTGFTIVNAAGNNVSLLNTLNYQTIMNIPPTNNLYPICSNYGYDSLAVKVVGVDTISEIPYISPYSFDPISVRLNSANANYRAARLKYVTTSSSTNKRLSFSFAVILNDPTSSPHASYESPYFKVEVKNESTGLVIPGCSSDDFNPKIVSASDSLKTSAIQIYGDAIKYRKWTYYSVDLSSLPLGTNVSINFEVGGSTKGGHTGYAYVDAECGGMGTPYVNMCSGSTFATLVAPTGFTSYQWIGPSGILPGEINDSLIVSSPTVGTTYTVNMISPAGCAVTQTVSIAFTTVNIINLNSSSSCAGGNSGTASLLPSGSNGVYTYTWTNIGTGQDVSNSQTATGLAPGSYSVLVASSTCGQASANLSVGVSPPFFYSQLKTFCGNTAVLIQPGGSNYTWYHNSAIIASPAGTNDTLIVNNVVEGDIYTVVYKNAQGCRDSLAYTLNQIIRGDVYFSNIVHVCPGATNGSALLNLYTPYPAPYSYFVSGPNNSTVIFNDTSSTTTLAFSGLAQGTYTALISDGRCNYNNTFDINSIQTNYTVTAASPAYCFPNQATLHLNIGDSIPLNCGVKPNLCLGTPIQLFSSGTYTQNGALTYPTPYGNSYTYGRNQYLVRKSELNAAGIFAGKISSLAFNVINMNNSVGSYPDFSIKMGCTGLTNLPNATTSSQPFVAGLLTVYTHTNQPVALGWVTHNFSQSYVWDGNSNILVEVCFSFPNPAGTGNYSQNASVQLKQVPYIAGMYHAEDTAPVCGGAQLANNSQGVLITSGINMLPNMRFGYCGIIPPKNSYTVAISPNGTITNNYTNDSITVSPTFSAPPAPNGSVIYTVSVTNQNGGCVATKTVEVLYPLLTPTITATITKTIICIGENTTLSAFGAYSYSWYYLQGTNLIPISSPSSAVTVTPPVSGTNTYVVTGYAPCANSTPDTVTVNVIVKPVANLIITPLLNVTKCLNKLVVFDADVSSTTANNPGTPYTYSWTTLPGNIPAPGINTDSTYNANSNVTTTLVVTVKGDCANSTSDTVVVKNFVDDLAIAIIDSSKTCANTAFSLNSITTGGHKAYSYSWYLAPNTNTISNTSILSYTSPSSEGTYTIVVNVNDSCGYQKTDFEIITVLPPCNVGIPNIITPNGDHANDFFKINNIEYHPNTNVTIFDRWGIKVYENPNYKNEWKADGVSDGTFFYVIAVPDDKTYSGFITVFRDK